MPLPVLAGAIALAFPLVKWWNGLTGQNLQRELEDRRERLTIEKAKADYLFQFTQGQINREFQAEQAQLGRDFQREESILAREFQADQAQLNRNHQSREAEIQRLFQHYENQLSREAQRELTEYVQGCENLRQQNRMEFDRQMARTRQEHEIKLQRMSQEFAIALAIFNNQLAKATDEYRRTLDNHPLRIFPTNLLDEYQTYAARNSQVPLLLLVSPLQVSFEKFVAQAPAPLPPMTIALEEDLSVFVQKHYPDRVASRYIASMWDSNRIKNDVAATHLHNLIPAIPTAILEFEAEGDLLNFRAFLWNAGSEGYTTHRLLSNFNFREFLYEIQKEKAKLWEQQKQELVKAGVDLKTICPPIDPQKNQTLSEHQINELNLQQLGQERLIPEGIDVQLPYIPSPKGWQELCKYLRVLACAVAGLVLDSYHLNAYGSDPQLPKGIEDLLSGLTQLEAASLLDIIVANYLNQAETLYRLGSERVPQILVNLAVPLANLGDKAWANRLLMASYRYWLQQRRMDDPHDHPLERVAAALTIADREYVQSVNRCLESFQADVTLDIATSCYQRGLRQLNHQEFDAARADFDQVIALNPHGDAYYQRARAYVGLGDHQNAIADLNKAIELQPNRGEAYELRGDAYAKQQNIEIALANYAEAVKYGATTAQRKRDELQAHWTQERRQAAEAEAKRQREAAERQRKAHDYFNGGVYHLERENFDQALADFAQAQQYGHPEAGQRLAETQQAKQRKSLSIPIPGTNLTLELVEIPAGSFQMGDTQNSDEQPVHTVHLQAYRMSKYQVTQKLYQAVMGSNPACFKGDDLPVEQVSWDDAKAFCQKLSEKIGQKVRLPSEAEWEYACRAGSTGEYGFGNDPKQLGNYAWYEGNAGRQTHPVGQKQANDWGLYDMHGNVWEWCEDVWHDSYNGAPTDGSAWVAGGESNRRVQRGGSWYFNARLCRSAFRCRFCSDGRFNYVGFRVVLSSSWELSFPLYFFPFTLYPSFSFSLARSAIFYFFPRAIPLNLP